MGEMVNNKEEIKKAVLVPIRVGSNKLFLGRKQNCEDRRVYLGKLFVALTIMHLNVLKRGTFCPSYRSDPTL